MAAVPQRAGRFIQTSGPPKSVGPRPDTAAAAMRAMGSSAGGLSAPRASPGKRWRPRSGGHLAWGHGELADERGRKISERRRREEWWRQSDPKGAVSPAAAAAKADRAARGGDPVDLGAAAPRGRRASWAPGAAREARRCSPDETGKGGRRLGSSRSIFEGWGGGKEGLGGSEERNRSE